MDYARALQILFPGTQWSIGDTYESLEWLDEAVPKPTQKELDAVDVDAIQAKQDAAKAELMAAFEALPLGAQAFYAPVKEAVAAALDNDDLPRAKAILNTAPKTVEELAEHGAKFVALASKAELDPLSLSK